MYKLQFQKIGQDDSKKPIILFFYGEIKIMILPIEKLYPMVNIMKGLGFELINLQQCNQKVKGG